MFASKLRQFATPKVAIAAGSVVGVAGAGASVAFASEAGLHPGQYPWVHMEYTKTFDAAGIRRGFEVYRQVCSSCHSLKRLSFRHFIGVSHTEQEIKKIAEEYEVEDGPDDKGEMFMRPGKPADYFPSPYPNEKAAAAMNGGAAPPDLSLIIRARHDGENYVFSLLTGYADAPAGVELREGLNYNPYFAGGAIGMGQPIYDGQLDYEDGTPCTTSQLAKDVVEFLTFCSKPEHDERKRMGMKAFMILGAGFAVAWYAKTHRWSYVKTRQLKYIKPKGV